MTSSEFKAWFEGFTEGMIIDLPNESQWLAVKKRVSEINNFILPQNTYPYLHHSLSAKSLVYPVINTCMASMQGATSQVMDSEKSEE